MLVTKVLLDDPAVLFSFTVFGKFFRSYSAVRYKCYHQCFLLLLALPQINN